MEVFADCSKLPSTQESDRPRLHLRSFFGHLGLCQPAEARAAFAQLPGTTPERSDEGAQQLPGLFAPLEIALLQLEGLEVSAEGTVCDGQQEMTLEEFQGRMRAVAVGNFQAAFRKW